jgi:hypothetical protein
MEIMGADRNLWSIYRSGSRTHRNASGAFREGLDRLILGGVEVDRMGRVSKCENYICGKSFKMLLSFIGAEFKI